HRKPSLRALERLQYLAVCESRLLHLQNSLLTRKFYFSQRRFAGGITALRTDQGPEFTSRALDQWAYANGVTLKLIQAGKPTQNAYIESFNGKFRDECLNEHWFTTLAQARVVIAAWRQDYNEARPHSALNYQSPAEFAAKQRATAAVPAVQEHV
uniref:integrase core domain-containing protein n=1 Tax=Pandoraea pnomenusa TaxID=93220 RepID=UPI00242FE269